MGEVAFQVLWPTADAPDPTAAEEASLRLNQLNLSNHSLVFRLSYGHFSALFTGDIYTVTEHALTKQYENQLECTLLKLPHHGGDTSNSGKLLDCVAPIWAVATGGYVNPAVINKLKKRDIDVFQTWFDGTVTVTNDGVTASLSSAQGEINFSLIPGDY